VIWSPSIAALKQAAAEGCNLVLAKDPLFWSEAQMPKTLSQGTVSFFQEGTAGPTPASVAEATDLAKFKKNMIESLRLNIVRISRGWDGQRSNALLGLIKALNWKEGSSFVADETLPNTKTAVVKIPQQSLIDLADYAKTHLNARSVRVLGDRGAKVSTVAVHPGYLTIKGATRIGMEKNLDVVLTGESCEWEGFEYFEDWISAGHGKGMLMAGLAVTSDSASREFASWAQDVLPGTKVKPIAVGDPFTPIHAGGLRA
jgi:hypothetical protein